MKTETGSKRQSGKTIARRRFLGCAAVAAGAVIVPRHVLGGPGNTPPSEKLNLAGIGITGMGSCNLTACEGENIMALCDVDTPKAQKILCQVSPGQAIQGLPRYAGPAEGHRRGDCGHARS